MADITLNKSSLKLSSRALLAGEQPITFLMSQALANPNLISLAAGFVDQVTLPVEETHKIIEAILSDTKTAQAALQYGTTIGYAPLRQVVLDRLKECDKSVNTYSNVSIDNIVVTAGSNQLLELVSETILDPSDIVLCASPSYFVYLGTLANLGARSRGVPTDELGIVPEALEEELERLEMAGDLSKVKAIYCVSYFDNPAGISLAYERRQAIVEIAKRWSKQHRIFILEDLAYRELRYSGEDLPSMRAFDEEGDTVITAGTFSKSFSPGVRVGWGLLPKDLVGPVCDQKGNIDFGSPNFAQHIIHRVVESGEFLKHVDYLRASYAKKMHAMLDTIQESFSKIPGVEWITPQGGLYVWMTLPEGLDTGPASRLMERATEDGVLYVPGQYCYPREGTTKTNTIRLSFGVQNEKNIRLGIKALAQAVQEVLSET